jgi:flavin reductase (DIM6/NTAB) family NADH-FMN oxidoreductase RutF
VAAVRASAAADRFGRATRWTPLATGEPWLSEAATALRCRPLARTSAGDATVVVAEVAGVRSTGRAGPAPVHHDRGFHVLGPAPLDS